MALKSETAAPAAPLRLTDAWIWPLTAAIVIGGSILFWCFVGLFWLAVRPMPQPVVIRVTQGESTNDPAKSIDIISSAESNNRGTP